MTREDDLRRIREIKNIEIPALEKEYLELRDEVVPEVEEDGLVYIIGPDGKKYRCTVTRAKLSVYDVDYLASVLDEEIFEEITERKVNSAKFDQAVGAGRIPMHVVQKGLTEKAKAPFINYELDGKKA